MEENSKRIGFLLFLFGLICLAPLFSPDKSKLIIEGASNILYKYFIIITFLNGGIFFIVLGILIFKGVLKPYFSQETTSLEKAKVQLFSLVAGAPFFLSGTVVIYSAGSAVFWRVLWTLLLAYLCWLLYESVSEIYKRTIRRP